MLKIRTHRMSLMLLICYNKCYNCSSQRILREYGVKRTDQLPVLFVCLCFRYTNTDGTVLFVRVVDFHTSNCVVTVWLYPDVEEHYIMWQLSLVTWVCELEGYFLSTLWVRGPNINRNRWAKGCGPWFMADGNHCECCLLSPRMVRAEFWCKLSG